MGGSPRRAARSRADPGLRLRLSFAIHGHRGARGLAPENTLTGFAQAIALGVDALELDVGLTADGIVVVTHDPQLNPDITRDDTGAWLATPGPPIRHLTRAALARFDVGRIRPGSSYAARFPDQVPCDGAGIPTLGDVLALDPAIRLTIEIKTFPDRPDVTAPAQVLAEAVGIAVAPARERVVVQAFDWRVLRHLQKRHPGLTLAWLTGAQTEADPALWWAPFWSEWPSPPATAPEAVRDAGGTIWAPEASHLTAEQVAAAHRLGLRVVPWTVNAPDEIGRLIRWGADGLISDYPDRVLSCRRAAASGQG